MAKPRAGENPAGGISWKEKHRSGTGSSRTTEPEAIGCSSRREEAVGE